MAELAKVAYEEHKLEKARKYMNLIVMSEEGRENGDLWALFFETLHKDSADLQ